MSRDNSRNRGRYGWRFRIREILSIWPDKDAVLSFTKIHNEFVKRGIVSDSRYKKSTSRILKKLIEEGYLEIVGKGYKLKVNPQPFTVIDKLKELQLKYGTSRTYEWRVGGNIWTLVEGVILGMPANINENPNFKIILEVLLMRVANIFEALRSLVLAIGTAERSGKDWSSITPPEEAVREFLLNLVPHVLGERSGIDGDGLPTEDLLEVIERMCCDLPDKVHSQPIAKRLLREMINIARDLYSQSANLPDTVEPDLVLDNSQAREIYKEYENLALIVYPPRHIFDEKGEEERRLYEYLKDCIEEGISNALMLAHMRHYDEKLVDKVLKYLKLQSLLPAERAKELKELYHLIQAGTILYPLIKEYYFLKEDGRLTSEKIEELKDRLNKAQQKYCLEKMIVGIWLSNWPKNIYPSVFSHETGENIVKFVSKVILDFFETLDVKPPTNLEKLVRSGYELVKKLDGMLKEDANKA